MLNMILSFCKCLLDFILLYWFSTLFFNQRWENSRAASCTVLGVLSVVIFLVNHLHIPLFNTVMALACTLALNFFLFKGHIAALLVISLAEVLLILLCEFIPISIYSVIVDSNIGTVTNETIRNAAFNLISTGISSVIILIIRYIITLRHRKENVNITISENLAIIIVPLVSILMVYYILFTSFDNQIHTVVPLHSIFVFWGILLMNIVVILGDSNLRKNYSLQRELDRLSRLEEMNQVVIEQQDQFIDELKGFAHDYVKQFEGIKKLIQVDDSSIKKDVEKYADEMYVQIEKNYRFTFIPSSALRSILTQAELRCISSGIRFDTDIQFADFSFVAFPDLYTLFDNPLDNAIRACNEIKDINLPKRIELIITRKRNLVCVKIKNSKSNPVVIRNGGIQSTKVDCANHGLGIKNMKRVICYYGGYINIDYSDTEFSIVMTVPVVAEG